MSRSPWVRLAEALMDAPAAASLRRRMTDVDWPEAIRLVLFPSLYSPHVGGVEQLTGRLAAHFVSGGDSVEVWSARHPESLKDDELVDGVRVRRFRLPLPRLAAPYPRGALGVWSQLRGATKDFEPDLLHVMCFSANGVYAAALARRVGLPFVLSLQGETMMDDHDVFATSATLRLALRLALRSAAAVTACSQFVLEDAERNYGLPPQRGLVIPNGVDVDGDAAPQPVTLPFSRFVLTLGRIVPKKGFDLLIDAFAQVAERQPDVGLVVGGAGPALDLLRADVLRRRLDGRVVFTGLLDRGEVAWLAAQAEVFVLPSRIEPFGIVVLEALRAGVPTIVSSRGGAPEIVRHERDGLVVDPLDRHALAVSLERLLADPSLRAQLGEAGSRRVADFDWSLVAAQYRSVYETALRTGERRVVGGPRSGVGT